MGTRYYDAEFKREAVRLVLEEGRSIRGLERALGTTQGLIKHWVKKERERVSGSPADQSAKADAKRIRELEKQLADVTMERDILKKAVAVFSLNPKNHSSS
ncbi:hypothetical protein R80B4_01050 [Fibrobacteres bacterium R8-0-B4]